MAANTQKKEPRDRRLVLRYSKADEDALVAAVRAGRARSKADAALVALRRVWRGRKAS